MTFRSLFTIGGRGKGFLAIAVFVAASSAFALREEADFVLAPMTQGVISGTSHNAHDRYFRDAVRGLDAMRRPTGFLPDKVAVRDRGVRGLELVVLNNSTSPTNIALDLLLQIERLAFGAGSVVAERALVDTVASLTLCEKHKENGLFYAWYDATTLEAQSLHLSSVDNMHLAFALWAVARAPLPQPVRDSAQRLFDAMNFALFFHEKTGFIAGLARYTGGGWVVEDWRYSYFGSEARLLYTLGTALQVFRRRSETDLTDSLRRLTIERTTVDKNHPEPALLRTWDGGLFQLYLPELLVAESGFSPRLRDVFRATARHVVRMGDTLELPSLGDGLRIPAAFSAANFGVDGTNLFDPHPWYVGHAGVPSLVATENGAFREETHRQWWDASVTPHAAFLASLGDEPLLVERLVKMETLSGPGVVSTREALYRPGLGFLDGYVVRGPHRGKVIPVVLHLDQAMAALVSSPFRRSKGMSWAAHALREDQVIQRRLQRLYELVEERLDSQRDLRNGAR